MAIRFWPMWGWGQVLYLLNKVVQRREKNHWHHSSSSIGYFTFSWTLSLVVASKILGSSLLTSFGVAWEKAPGLALNPTSPHSFCSECSSWTSIMSITWEPVRKAESQTHPPPTEPKSAFSQDVQLIYVNVEVRLRTQTSPCAHPPTQTHICSLCKQFIFITKMTKIQKYIKNKNEPWSCLSVNTFPICFNWKSLYFLWVGGDPFLYQAITTSSKYILMAASIREGGRK